MFEPLSNREKQLVKLIEHYEKQNIDLQLLTGINLDQLLEIAMICTLYININGENYSLYNIADEIKKTKSSFADIYYNKKQSESLIEILDRLSLEMK